MDAHAHIFNPAFPLSPARSYTPGRALLGEYGNAAAGWNAGRMVLVQPSPYGSDNSVLLSSLRELGPAKARGIAVISGQPSDGELDELGAAGVVGVRLNRQADPRGGYEPLVETLGNLIQRVAARGWIVQLYSDPESLAACQDVLAASTVPILLDHYAGLRAGVEGFADATQMVLDLVKNPNVWVKFSGPYRACQPAVDHSALAGITRKLSESIPDRLVWGSDWPYTGGGKDRANRSVNDVEPFRNFDAANYLQQVTEWVGDREHVEKLLIHNPTALFGF